MAAVQAGSILIEEWPVLTNVLGMESEHYSGNWSLLNVLDGFALDRKVRESGWNCFFVAAEVKAMFFGAVGAEKVRKTMDRILLKVKAEHFNCLEVTGIVARRFLGLPYVVVSAHSRHIQPGCYLDATEARRASQHNAEWARG